MLILICPRRGWGGLAVWEWWGGMVGAVLALKTTELAASTTTALLQDQSSKIPYPDEMDSCGAPGSLGIAFFCGEILASTPGSPVA